jgi:hypothetical protein
VSSAYLLKHAMEVTLSNLCFLMFVFKTSSSDHHIKVWLDQPFSARSLENF